MLAPRNWQLRVTISPPNQTMTKIIIRAAPASCPPIEVKIDRRIHNSKGPQRSPKIYLFLTVSYIKNI